MEVFSNNELIPLTKQGCTYRHRLSRNYKPKGTGNWQAQLADLESGKKGQSWNVMISHEMLWLIIISENCLQWSEVVHIRAGFSEIIRPSTQSIHQSPLGCVSYMVIYMLPIHHAVATILQWLLVDGEKIGWPKGKELIMYRCHHTRCMYLQTRH